MISYPVYKLVHYLGMFLLLMALSAGLARAAGAPRDSDDGSTSDPWRRRLLAAHGLGLFLVLLGGFGMLARLEITHELALPGWIWAKLGIWGALGAAVAFRRSRRLAAAALALAPLLALLAGWVALYKPL
jgi:hypothetical protein